MGAPRRRHDHSRDASLIFRGSICCEPWYGAAVRTSRRRPRPMPSALVVGLAFPPPGSRRAARL